MSMEKSGRGGDKTRYNAVRHGLYFSGIMRCNVCKLKDCPLRKADAFCAKEMEEMKDLENMGLDDLREKIVLHFGKLLVMMMIRCQVQSGFAAVKPQTYLKILEMAAKFVTSSKGRIRASKKGFAKLLVENAETKEEKKK